MKKLASIAALATAVLLAAPAAGHAAVDTSKTYRITTSWSLAVEVAGASRSDGAPVDQWPLNGGTNQQWNLNANGTVTGVQSGLCLDASGNATANGTLIHLWSCHGGANQQWTLRN